MLLADVICVARKFVIPLVMYRWSSYTKFLSSCDCSYSYSSPVGDCHYFAIAKKWTKLQTHALRIIDKYPHLVHQIHYEAILENKVNVVQHLYDFIGERRFGGIKRQASVLFMKPAEDLINQSKHGRESLKACCLSYQFQNLHRGPSFAKNQNQKWKHQNDGLKEEEIQLIESVAHQIMAKLGYKPHLVGVKTQPTIFSDHDFAIFDAINKKGIERMYEQLKRENPGDFHRRQHQAEILQFQPTLIDESKWIADRFVKLSADEAISSVFLSQEEFAQRLTKEPSQSFDLSNHRHCRFGSATLQGYYPEEQNMINQDRSLIKTLDCKHNARSIWFSVFDGHGPYGHLCSEYVASNIVELFEKHACSSITTHKALEKAHQGAHKILTSNHDIDTTQSGTTAATILLNDNTITVSNVGDSSCILGYREFDNKMGAKLLCKAHTPLRADELERIQRAGGLVMTTGQRDGVEPLHQNWTTDNPPRIWSPSKRKFPGCGFTRSIGDNVAHTLGVTALPETIEHTIGSQDHVLIVATDGVTECEFYLFFSYC
mmetsp:Transcript_23237/g.35852  ORF Transcript_23237/g.35852 Transcript_23237/m.35852 type:complete len:545 (-) Transcript_23237:40-1674(-)